MSSLETVLLFVGVAGLVLLAVGLVADLDFAPGLLPGVGVAAAAFGWVGLLATSSGASPTVAVTAAVVVAAVGVAAVIKLVLYMSREEHSAPQLTGLPGSVATVTSASADGAFAEVALTIDGVPVRFPADNDDPVSPLQAGDEVIILEVVSPRKLRIKRV